eukprot:101665-Pyramimonas_sp.AAC.1
MEPIIRPGRPRTKSITHFPQRIWNGEGDRLPICTIHLLRGRRGSTPLPEAPQPVRLHPEDT